MFHKKNNDPDIEPNTKYLALRVVLFVLAAGIAIASFVRGVSRIGTMEPGLYEVDATIDKEFPIYSQGMSLHYYFGGSRDEIREEMIQLREVYSNALKRAYILLDAGTEREGWKNLATLNAHPGETVELDPALFAVLEDAYALTRRQEGYNLFAGPLYAVWNEVLYLNEPQPFDPINNADTRRRVERVAAVNDADAVRFEIVDRERCAVRYQASDKLLALLSEYELPQTVLDLNILHDAYELKLVADALEAAGWNSGYLSTDSGITLSLSRYTGGEFCLYGQVGADTAPAAKADAAPGAAYSQTHIFPYYTGEPGFYSVQTGDGELLRHPYLTASGTHPDALASCCVIDYDGDVVGVCWENLRLAACANAAEAEALLNAPGAHPAAYILSEEEKTVHINAAGAEKLHPAEDYGFRAAK